MKKLPLYLIMLFFIVGCASNVKMVDKFGNSVPNTVYTTKALGDTGMFAVFYFANYQEKKDLDGTTIYTPMFPEWREKATIKKDSRLEMVVEIYNPKEMTYLVYSRIGVDKKIGVFKDSIGKMDSLNRSNQPQRRLVLELPTTMIAEHIFYILEITSTEGVVIFNVGPFKYSVES